MYVGNLSYDVKYRDLIEFMRGGGWGRFSSWSLLVFLVVVAVAAAAAAAVEAAPVRLRARSRGARGKGLDTADELWGSLVSFSGFDGPW